MVYHSGNELIDQRALFEKAQIQPGMHIADFGCGRTGHLIFPAAVIVGEKGVLYAIDILKNVLQSVRSRARMDGLINVETVWSDLERVGATAIPEHSLDIIFVVNMLYQTKDHQAVLDEAMRLLKKKGRIVVVDWHTSASAFSPEEEQLVDFVEVEQWAIKHSFAIQEKFMMGQYHKGMILFRHD